jgi:hypothetical protein
MSAGLIVGLTSAFLLVTLQMKANAQDYVKLGISGFAMWKCASLGVLTDNSAHNAVFEKLFVNGHEQLTILVTGIVNGNVSKAELDQIPSGIGWWLTGGPSIEFRMGYMWAQFQKEAYDRTWPKETNGKFDEQKSLQKLQAEAEFQNGNCKLLK